MSQEYGNDPEEGKLRTRKKLANFYVAVQFLSLALLFLFDLAAAKTQPHQYVVIEFLSIGLGLLVIVVASKSLQPSLKVSPIPKTSAPLIESGIYKYLRHPMYLGVILIGFGMAGYSNHRFAWGVALILLIDLNLKARFEDKLLREIHPESLHYQRRTSRIFPWR